LSSADRYSWQRNVEARGEAGSDEEESPASRIISADVAVVQLE
jgi:hypothetical protein